MILFEATSPEDWKRYLADPTHWKKGHSATSLAYCWHEANGFPLCVSSAFKGSGFPIFKEAEPLLAIPEYKVPLPGGVRASQNDIFVLAKSQNDLIAIMVEGKVNEPFGPLVNEWFKNPSTGKQERLEFLCKKLGLDQKAVLDVRYQLLHRSASAIIEAKRFNAPNALMLVHSFSPSSEWFGDYVKFASLYGIDAKPNQVHYAGKVAGVTLYLAWVKGNERYSEFGPER